VSVFWKLFYPLAVGYCVVAAVLGWGGAHGGHYWPALAAIWMFIAWAMEAERNRGDG
jgi:hypothetical protein